MTQLSRNNTSAAAILKCSNQNQEVCTKLTFLYGFFLWKAKSHFIVGVLGQNTNFILYVCGSKMQRYYHLLFVLVAT